MIRDFRGSITGRADKGLFITTGTFSREALIEANRDGATHIELIDGDKLYEIFYDTGLAFTIDKTEINEDFFDEYK
jgi:restriction system protein